jgi:hypothetical protein
MGDRGQGQPDDRWEPAALAEGHDQPADGPPLLDELEDGRTLDAALGVLDGSLTPRGARGDLPVQGVVSRLTLYSGTVALELI